MSLMVLWAAQLPGWSMGKAQLFAFPSTEDLSSHQGDSPGHSCCGYCSGHAENWKAGHVWDASVASSTGNWYIPVSLIN